MNNVVVLGLGVVLGASGMYLVSKNQQSELVVKLEKANNVIKKLNEVNTKLSEESDEIRKELAESEINTAKVKAVLEEKLNNANKKIESMEETIDEIDSHLEAIADAFEENITPDVFATYATIVSDEAAESLGNEFVDLFVSSMNGIARAETAEEFDKIMDKYDAGSADIGMRYAAKLATIYDVDMDTFADDDGDGDDDGDEDDDIDPFSVAADITVSRVGKRVDEEENDEEESESVLESMLDNNDSDIDDLDDSKVSEPSVTRDDLKRIRKVPEKRQILSIEEYKHLMYKIDEAVNVNSLRQEIQEESDRQLEHQVDNIVGLMFNNAEREYIALSEDMEDDNEEADDIRDASIEETGIRTEEASEDRVEEMEDVLHNEAGGTGVEMDEETRSKEEAPEAEVKETLALGTSGILTDEERYSGIDKITAESGQWRQYYREFCDNLENPKDPVKYKVIYIINNVGKETGNTYKQHIDKLNTVLKCARGEEKGNPYEIIDALYESVG